jgi:hypothetical protein
MTQYVLMAIPAEFVPSVAALIAEFDANADLEVQVEAPERGTSPDGAGSLLNGWTEDLVSRAFKESANPMRRVLLFLADHAGEEVTSIEIADAIDAKYGWNTVAGMLGAFGRRSVNRYKRSAPMWEWRPGSEGILIKMPVAVAAVIKKVAAE